MAAEPTFVDTNVLIGAGRSTSAFYGRAHAALLQARQEGRPLWLSRQILREYLAVVTRPQPSHAPLPMAAALADIDGFERDFNIAEDGSGVFGELRRLLTLTPTAGKQVHDANIAATMLDLGLKRLLTFNGADFRRFASMIEVVAP